jgi:AcrR family transcriptional regulator
VSHAIEDITERANLGRTTFYLHYQSKDDLLLEHTSNFTSHVSLKALSRNQLSGVEPIDEITVLLHDIQLEKNMYLAILHGKDGETIRRNIVAQFAKNLAESCAVAFPNVTPNLPIDFL